MHGVGENSKGSGSGMTSSFIHAPASASRDVDHRAHFAHLYEGDDALVDAVTEYVGGALASGASAIVLATAGHRSAFEARWRAAGLDLAIISAGGRYRALDAHEVLARILVDGRPDRERFFAVCEPLVADAGRQGTRLVVFGELVGVLWRDGAHEAALRIETFWNELARAHPFSLCCGYPACAVDDAGTAFRRICAEHTLTVPGESYTRLRDDNARLAYIGELQQRANSLDRELAHRRAAEALLERKARELDDFLDDATYAIHSVGADGTLLSANRFELEMLGYGADEYIGRNVRDFYVGDVPMPLQGDVENTTTLRDQPARMRRKDGSIRDVVVTTAVYGRDGFLHTRCFTRDVTEQLRAQRAVDVARELAHTSDELLAAIVASSDDAIVSKTLDGRVTSWNRGAHRLFGYEPGEMIGESILTIVPPELHDEEREILRRLSRGERIEHFETVRLRKDGERVEVSLTISPIRDKDGRVVGASKVARDITDRKRIEEQLRVADRRKDEFLAMLGHELRNPLAPIRTVAEVLRRTLVDNPRAVELCAILERQVQQMTRLLDDLLDVTRITRGTIRFQRERVDVSSVIQRAVEASGALITRRKQRLRVGMPKNPVYVQGDFARLVQLVTNLLNNAAKYTPVYGRIALRVVRRGEQFDIRVHDNGAGITPEMLPRVFDLFVQSEAAGGLQEGLGIGLTLVRVIAEHHRGHVVARSAGPGRGSQFVVTLPVDVGDGARQAPVASSTAAPASRKRIVIVDDNRDALESLATLLRLAGHEVTIASDGASGLRIVDETRPDLALLDIGLPGMSGYEVARRLREAGCSVPLAAVTGYGTPEDRERTRAAGFDHHLVKPVDTASLERLLGSTA
jgi:PAS domain S-box-containing protein